MNEPLIHLLSSILAVMAAFLLSTPVLADPITHKVGYLCPAANSLSNFGNYIAGFGSEILSKKTTNKIYFQSNQFFPNIPSSLANYNNLETNYDGPTGSVTCSFASSDPAEGNFSISYSITNGRGGQILSKTSNTISVLFLVGLK